MWVRFTTAFSFSPAPSVTIVYRADGGPFKDGRYSVTRDCGEAAVVGGAGEIVPKPRRPK